MNNLKNKLMIIMHSIGIIVLLKLGFWQYDRLKWKEEIIANYQKNSNLPMSDLPQKFDITKGEFSDYKLSGTFDDSNSVFMFSKCDENNQIGYYVYTPFKLNDGRIFLVNRGWISSDQKEKILNFQSTEKEIEAVALRGTSKSNFTPKDDFKDRVVMHLDLDELRKELNVNLGSYFFVQKNSKSSRFIEKKITANFRNDHFAYAATWFSLAFTNMAMLIMLFIKTRKKS